MMKNPLLTVLFLFCLIFASCVDRPAKEVISSGSPPEIFPDYSGIVIPENIAPLNFKINIPGSAFHVKIKSDSGDEIAVSSRTGCIRFPPGRWSSFTANNRGGGFSIEVFVKNRAGVWQKYNEIRNYIASDPFDPFLYYRLLYPGYESWAELSINMRRLSDFKTKTIIKNNVVDENCVNCHAFNNGKTDDFLFHMRGSLAGTYFYSGNAFRKINLKTEEMKSGATYPRWHPSGKYVPFYYGNIQN